MMMIIILIIPNQFRNDLPLRCFLGPSTPIVLTVAHRIGSITVAARSAASQTGALASQPPSSVWLYHTPDEGALVGRRQLRRRMVVIIYTLRIIRVVV